jgi:hypothetical protein
VRKCAYQECPNFFVATHRRMRFCPPWRENVSASPCGNRAKVGRFRARI